MPYLTGAEREDLRADEMPQHGPADRTESALYAYSDCLPLLIPACLLLDGPADLPQVPAEGV